MEKQSVPSASNCPYCGSPPQYNPEHNLSAIGYTHDDIVFTCSECDEEWPCGVPIGDVHDEYAQDLFCNSCESRYGLVHRVDPKDGYDCIVLHMKCPNCTYFWKSKRQTGPDGKVLTGYPHITGSIRNAKEPEGYS
jgi:hypothetical protein